MSNLAKSLSLLFLVCLCLGGCGGGDDPSEQPARRPGGGPASVRVETVERRTIHQRLEVVGELAPRRSVAVASRIPGRVAEILVELGAEVEEGQLLARLDDGPLRAQVGEAGAAYKVAKASVRRAEAEHRATASELARKAPLAEDDLVTPLEMDNLRSRRDAARAAVAVAEAQSDQAAAHLQRLRQDMQDTRLTAPFAGRIASRLVDPGAVVSSGSSILSLVHTDPVVARFRLSEAEVGLVHGIRSAGGDVPSIAVVLSVPAYRGRQWRGRLVRVAPSLGAESRAAEAEAEFSNPDGELMPGMYCRLELELGERAGIVQVPLMAVMMGRGEQGPKVFVVRDGKAREVEIRLGVQQDGFGEVLEGLSPGDVVVVEGQDRLRDGQDVRVSSPGADAGPEPVQGAKRR